MDRPLKMIFCEDDDSHNLKSLQSEKLFKRLSILDLFALSLAYGKKQDLKTPLEGKRDVLIHDRTLRDSNVDYLMMAIGAEETGSLDVLTSNEYIEICEEYAKAGLHSLEDDYYEDPKKFLVKLELEALKYYDKHIEEK